MRTAGAMGGIVTPATAPNTTSTQSGTCSTARAKTAAALTTTVNSSSHRVPNFDMSLVVTGVAIAWPAEMAASTRPAAA